jgi:hypothetical protein
MDEITLFETLKPAPPGDEDALLQEVGGRLDRSLRGRGARGGPVARQAAARRAAARLTRRRWGLALAACTAAAVCAAIVIPLATAGPKAQPIATSTHPANVPTHGTTGAGQHVPLITTAYAVRRGQNGVVTLDIKQLDDPGGLQQALAAAGVPAVVQEEHLSVHPQDGAWTIETCVIAGLTSYLEPASVQKAVLRQVDPGVLMDGATWLPAQGGTLSASFGSPASHPRDLPRGAEMILHPQALPAGAAVYLNIGTYDIPGQGTTWEATLQVVNTRSLPACVPGGTGLPAGTHLP